jgi:predicted nucleic acid-binding protein
VAFLADTSVWVDWLKGTESPESLWLRDAIVEDFDLLVPGIVVTEVLRGVPGEREARRLEYLFGQFDAAPALDDRDYRDAARLYRHCRAKGVTIPSTTDCLIAQLAVRHRLTMVTRDRDFQAIARVTSLSVARLPAH